MHKEARDEIIAEKSRIQKTNRIDDIHLKKTVGWLIRAHDQGKDAGVSRGYATSPLSDTGYKGWQPSYPETTGYLIPTFFAATSK